MISFEPKKIECAIEIYNLAMDSAGLQLKVQLIAVAALVAPGFKSLNYYHVHYHDYDALGDGLGVYGSGPLSAMTVAARPAPLLPAAAVVAPPLHPISCTVAPSSQPLTFHSRLSGVILS